MHNLPLPSVYKGGFMRPMVAIGYLNGTPLPQMEIWSKPDKYEDARRETARVTALSALSDAPDGSTYAYRQACTVENWIEERTFTKVNGEWILTFTYSYP